MHHKRIECDHCSAKFKNRKSLIRHWIGFHEFKTWVDRMVARAIERGKRLPNPEGKPHRKVRQMQHMARLKKEEKHSNKKRIGAQKARARGFRR